MPAVSVISLAQEYWRDAARFRSRYDHPWLVWSLGRPSEAPIVAPTLSIGGASQVPNVGDPLALPVVKGKASIFVMGITVGRTENNDVVLRHEQVSRFHAYFTHGAEGYALVDAESKNGTSVGGQRLAPKRPFLLPERCRIAFGELEVSWFSAAAFVEHVSGNS